jgi:competence protein ComGC
MYLDPSIKMSRWSSEWNFGLIAMLVLGVLSIAALLIMPEIFTQ